MVLLMILHLYIISVGCYVPAVWYNVGLFRKKNTVKVIFVVWSQQIKAFDVAQESVSIYKQMAHKNNISVSDPANWHLTYG